MSINASCSKDIASRELISQAVTKFAYLHRSVSKLKKKQYKTKF